MKELEALQGIDVYLIDQLLKGRIHSTSKILDAGCGGGRNIHYLMQNGFDVTGVDANEEAIQYLQELYPNQRSKFICSSLEEFDLNVRFDFIICNAVLHFADGHDHFQTMFKQLVKHLSNDGILFIRMTSTIGLDLNQPGKNGVFNLPDESIRYLISRKQIDELMNVHPLHLLEPVKTVKVEELRSMSTIVFQKAEPSI